MNAHVTWAKGGTASFVLAADDAVTLRSTIPSPPGSRLEGTLGGEPEGAALTIKIHGSKLESDGSFTLRGKLLTATRALRARVASLVQAAP